MPLNFPASPSVGQTYSFGTRSWTWNGSTWVGGSSSYFNSFPFDEFSGNGSTVNYTLSYYVPNNSSALVTVSGVTQAPDGTSYSISSNQLTFTSPPPVGTNNIVVLYLSNYTTAGYVNANLVSSNVITSNTLTSNVISANTLYIASQNANTYIQSYIQQNTLSPFLLAGL